MNTVGGLLRSMRTHQWVKNVFVFAALFFSGNLFKFEVGLRSLVAFVGFCLLSSCVYIVNDILDRELDRLHPVKRHRAIASGEVSVLAAALLAVFLLVVGLAACAWLSAFSLAVGTLYAALCFLYSFWLKRVVILDVMVLAAGYALRAIAGAVAIDVDFSNWLLICTSLLALFLGFCKRRQELTSLEEEASAHRVVLDSYSEQFLDQMIAVVTASTVICYLLYAFDAETAKRLGTPYLGFTVPYVLYGIFRYFFMVHQLGVGGRPAREVVSDIPLRINVLLYGLTVVAILYWV